MKFLFPISIFILASTTQAGVITPPISTSTIPSSTTSSIASPTLLPDAPTTTEELIGEITTAPDISDDEILSGKFQEKWHLTTFSSCHTFDQTYIYCGMHEPVLPGGDEIAAAPRSIDGRAVAWAAVVMVFGAFLR